ncbi:MAG: putative bifunctional diguanylate cyclase/phosphodiesterase [Acidimicrobiales bacterium]
MTSTLNSRHTTTSKPSLDSLFPDSSGRSQFYSQILSLAAVTLYSAALLFTAHSHAGSSSALIGWLGRIATLAPVVPIYFRVRKQTELRGAWFIMGLGVLFFNLGSLLQSVPLTNLTRVVTPTLRDVVFLLSYFAIAVAVAVVMQQSFGPQANSVRLDGIIAGLALASLASMYWFRQDIELSGRPLIAELTIFNPLLVMALLVLLVAGLVPKHFHSDARTSLLIVGLSAFATSDVIQLNPVVFNSSVYDALVSASRPIGLCCVALAAWPRTDRRSGARGSLVAPRGLNFIPIIFGTLSVAILALSVVRSFSESTRFMALASLMLVIIRMVMTQSEVRLLGRSNFVEARTDHVTGLSNQRAFLEDGEAKLAALEPSQQLGIVLIDLDGFKEVNDSIGHAYGDELLKIVGQRFAKRIADRGSVARLGGDEFAYTFVIDAGVDPCASAKELAWTLSNPVSLDGTKVRVNASVGVSIWPQHGETHVELLRSADVAMYEAKRSHVDVCVYRDEIDVNSRERLSLIDDLRTAIERRRLTLHFQPTRDLRTNGVHGVEALVRWDHPTLGFLQPDDFIPLAERVGLIVPLTRTVLDLAIAELARLDRSGHSLQMSVNISRWDLMDQNLAPSIDRMLEWHHIDASRITLEVTESSLSQDPVRAMESLERLRTAGLKVSIDDFGVGYSSMSQLLVLPVDELKIDKSFILALNSDRRAISLIRSMIEMARALGLVVIAEGIENAVNFDLLRKARADIIQGDFVSRPLTSSQLDEFLSREAAVNDDTFTDFQEKASRRRSPRRHLRVV